jgi:hypothetical protein
MESRLLAQQGKKFFFLCSGKELQEQCLLRPGGKFHGSANNPQAIIEHSANNPRTFRKQMIFLILITCILIGGLFTDCTQNVRGIIKVIIKVY